MAQAGDPGDPGDQGILSIVDRAGCSIVQVPDWLASTFGVYAFSPDGHYLAGCFAEPNNLCASDRMRVIDVQTGSVSAPIGSECIWNGNGWVDDDRLYVSGLNRPQAWTPDGGATSLKLAKGLTVTPALNGNLAIWSDGSPDSTLELRFNGRVEKYQLPGLGEVSWSPDGGTLAAIDSELTLIRVAGR